MYFAHVHCVGGVRLRGPSFLLLEFVLRFLSRLDLRGKHVI
jgi:hypothetical protein